MLPQKVNDQSGIGLLQAILISAVLTSTGYFLYFSSLRNYENRTFIDASEDLEMVKKQVLDYMDCRVTLGTDPNTPVPFSCTADQVFSPKMRDGTEIAQQGKIGLFLEERGSKIKRFKWEIRARCERSSHLIIERKSLNKRASVSAFFSKGISDWQPLWIQDPLLCREYFVARRGTCKSSRYPIYAQSGESHPTCCRVQAASSPSGAVTATCDANEYALGGGGECSSPQTPLSGIKTQRTMVSTIQCPIKGIKEVLVVCGAAKGKTMVQPFTGPNQGGNELHTHLVPRQFGSAKGTLKDVWRRETSNTVGFLVQSRVSVNPASRVQNGWIAECRRNGSEQTRFDDWRGTYGASAVTLCCPKKVLLE